MNTSKPQVVPLKIAESIWPAEWALRAEVTIRHGIPAHDVRQASWA